MALYKVVEKRMFEETTFIEAEDETAASQFLGAVTSVYSGDSWGYELVSIEEVGSDV